ncbi:MAG: insulinase family protein [Bacteroidales bacterium]|jgi:predicted Zn-dependent peptidase|nr:insulinase family protein [Bacteroidales bacterium]
MKNMKHILYSLFLAIILIAPAKAQLDRSIRPKAGPAPEIKIGEYKTFTLSNGLNVIVVENHKVPVVSYQLTLDVDPVMEKDAVGYISTTGDLLRAGTTTKSKAEIDEQVDFIGATLNTYSNGIYARSLKKHSEELLGLMSDVLLNPVFPESELEKNKKQSISGLKSSETSPGAIANRVAQKLRYPNLPYGEIQTEETINNITQEKCLNYYNQYYKPNTAYLVIVGDITEKEAKQSAEKYFGQWEKGDVPEHAYQFPNKNMGTRVAIVDKEDAVQSIIKITYPINLKPGSEDYIPAFLTNQILGGGIFSGRLMQNLREDKGYTYGARSSISADPLAGYFEAGAEVGTEVTDSAITEFIYEMNRIRKENVKEDEMELSKNVSTGTFALSLERPQTLARLAFNTQRYNLPEDYYATYLEKLNAVTIQEVQQMAQKYITPEHAIILVVGDKKKLYDRLKPFDADGNIEVYDAYGKPVQEQKEIKIPAGVTAQTVIDNYVEAVGGKEKLAAMEDITVNASTEMSGMKINQVTYQKAPNKYSMKMSMNGNVITEQKFNGEVAVVKSFQGEQKIEGEQLEKFKIESTLNPELNYDKLGINLELSGIESVQEKDAYKIKVESPTGDVKYDFYDVESGLKIQTKQKVATPQGEMTQTQFYLNYEIFDGIKYPTLIRITGMQNLELKVDSVKINTGLKDELFE